MKTGRKREWEKAGVVMARSSCLFSRARSAHAYELGGKGMMGGCDEVRETDTFGFVWTQRFHSKP